MSPFYAWERSTWDRHPFSGHPRLASAPLPASRGVFALGGTLVHPGAHTGAYHQPKTKFSGKTSPLSMVTIISPTTDQIERGFWDRFLCINWVIMVALEAREWRLIIQCLGLSSFCTMVN